MRLLPGGVMYQRLRRFYVTTEPVPSGQSSRRIFRDSSGNIMILFGFLLLPLLGAVGVAVDSSRAYAVRAHLQASLDAAALVGANNISASNRDALMQSYFDANWHAEYQGAATPAPLTVTSDASKGTLYVTTTVDMPTVFMRLFGTNQVAVSAAAGAEKPQGSTLEVALALDTTASMVTMIGTQRRVDAAKAAARSFVDSIFTKPGDTAPSATLEGVYVSVIPFTSVVNVGPSNTSFLATNSTTGVLWAPQSANASLKSWRGCVFERSFYNEGAGYLSNDLTDAPPSVEPYWPYHVVPSSLELYEHCYDYPAPSSEEEGGPPPDVTPVDPPVYVNQDRCYGPVPRGNCKMCLVDGIPEVCSGQTVVPGYSTLCYTGEDRSEIDMSNCPAGTSLCSDSNASWDAVCTETVSVQINSARAATASTSRKTRATTLRSALRMSAHPAAATNTASSGFPLCPVPPTTASDPDVTNGLTDAYTDADYDDDTLYVPYATYIGANGLPFLHPPARDDIAAYTPSMTYNAAVPALINNSTDEDVNSNKVSICCYGGYDSWRDAFWWTQTGRWIAPWSSNTGKNEVKFGGWGNSGCGLPLRPLSEKRADALDLINRIDLVATVSASRSVAPSYSGTLIQQGLAWGWRTLSPKWRGLWKDESGGAIDATLPLDPKSGSVKAVIVLTDGLNALSDPTALRSDGYERWFIANGSYFKSVKEPNLSFPGNANNKKWWLEGFDISAYGLIGRDTTITPAGEEPPADGALSFCRLRQQAAAARPSIVQEPVLANWGCREYDCMLRNASGQCVTSTAGITPSDSVDDAQFGPYFDELERRLIATCTNMRAEGVRPYFILFDVAAHPRKTKTLAALPSCVGSMGGVYDATDVAALNAAFTSIAASLKKLRLTR